MIVTQGQGRHHSPIMTTRARGSSANGAAARPGPGRTVSTKHLANSGVELRRNCGKGKSKGRGGARGRVAAAAALILEEEGRGRVDGGRRGGGRGG